MLTILSGKRKIRDFIVYDMEWVPGTLELRMIGAYDRRKGYRWYTTIEDFMECELSSENRGKWFYAHFGGVADVQFVVHYLRQVYRRKGYRVNGAFTGSSLSMLHIHKGKNAWHMVDSGRLLPDKLAKIAEAIGMQKGSEDFMKNGDPDESGITDEEYERRCQNRREWYATTSLENLRIYNENDCEILYNAIDQFETGLLDMGGQLQMTLASCGMYLFRRKYLHRDIETSPAVNEIAREAYTASRVEVFQQSASGANYYDINSSFPHAMTFETPGNYRGSSKRIPNSEQIYIADVEIGVPDHFLTPVPLRMKQRIFFPVGRWRAWLTKVDVELLVQNGGRIFKVHEVMHFDSFNGTKMYAEDIYSKRKKATSTFEKLLYKLLLNCLYGKFAETSDKEELLIDPKEIDRSVMQLLMPGVWVREKEAKVPHVHVPISAYITAIARRSIFNFLASCNEVHYCDTDGFSTMETLPTSDELGGLKHEKRNMNGFYPIPKLYWQEGEALNKKGEWEKTETFKAKGMSRMTASRFNALLEGQTINYERMARVKENMKRGESKPTEIMTGKSLNLTSIYDDDFNAKESIIPKRFTYPNGTTRPWSVGELNELVKEIE